MTRIVAAVLVLFAGHTHADDSSEAPDSLYDSTYASHFADKQPPHFMACLPDGLVVRHAASLALESQRENYEHHWARGMPEFHVAEVDTAIAANDTLLWVLFSDGYLGKLQALHLRGGQLSTAPCNCDTITGGMNTYIHTSQATVIADMYPDIVVMVEGHRQYGHYKLYAWLGDSVAYLGGITAVGYEYALLDLQGDGVMEVVTNEDDPNYDWGLRKSRPVVYQIINGKYAKSEELTAQWRESGHR